MNLEFKREMPSAELVKTQFPIAAEASARKRETDTALQAIFTGESERFLLVIGPCSADREDAVSEYLLRLCRVREQVAEKIVIVPRLYAAKPRTTGDGYLGMLFQPDPAGSPDLLTGLSAIRRLQVKALTEFGFSCADELLYPETYPYFSDCISYAAIGARSVENQFHRLVSSGLDIPVGMKNPTDGNLHIMLNAIYAAQRGHTFLYSGCEVCSRGNPLAHAVLRGCTGDADADRANYTVPDLLRLQEAYANFGLQNPAVLVDTNHANSGKHWEEQPRIAKEVLQSRRQHPELRYLIKGLMVESYLLDGCQSPGGTALGQSVTDPCLGWEKTERLIFELAELL